MDIRDYMKSEKRLNKQINSLGMVFRPIYIVCFLFIVTSTLLGCASNRRSDKQFKVVLKNKQYSQQELDRMLLSEASIRINTIEKGIPGRKMGLKGFEALMTNRAFMTSEQKSKMKDYLPKYETIKMLLEKGANVNIRDHKGRTPLLLLACFEPEISMLLVEKGADVNARSFAGRTPLIAAATGGVSGADLGTVKLLIDEGADKSVADNKGKTALDYARAAKHQNKDIIDLLK